MAGILAMMQQASYPLSYELTDSADDSSDATTYTFTGKDINTGGLVIVGIIGRHFSVGTRTVSSVTIGGSAATLNVASGAGFMNAGIASLFVSATTATIAVTFSGAMEGCSIVVWVLNNYGSATPFHTGAATPAVSPLSTNLNLPPKGVAFVVFGHFNTNDTTLTNATESLDTDLATPTASYGAGEYRATAAETSRAIGTSWTDNSGVQAMASWS